MSNNFNLKQYISEGKLLNEIEVKIQQPPLVAYLPFFTDDVVIFQTLKGIKIMKSILDDLNIKGLWKEEDKISVGNHPLYEEFLKETGKTYDILQRSSIPNTLEVEDFDDSDLLPDTKLCIGVSAVGPDPETTILDVKDAGIDISEENYSGVFTSFIGD